MTIEVRQLTIRSRVGEPDDAAAGGDAFDGAALDEERVRQLVREGLEQWRRSLQKRTADDKER